MKAEEVGYRIAQARKKQGMTQRELSERLHVSDRQSVNGNEGLTIRIFHYLMKLRKRLIFH